MFEKTLARIKAERSGEKPQKRKEKKKPKEKPKPKKVTPKKKNDEIKAKIKKEEILEKFKNLKNEQKGEIEEVEQEKETVPPLTVEIDKEVASLEKPKLEIEEVEQEKETEPPLTVETAKEEEILEKKKLEIEEVEQEKETEPPLTVETVKEEEILEKKKLEIEEEEQEKETEPPLTVETATEEEILEKKKLEIEETTEENQLIEKEVLKMTEQQEEIPLMKFEGDATAPILRYDLPSPSFYEGRNFIELNDIPIEKFNEEVVYNTKSYQEVMVKNREEIRSYLSNISRAELEEDFFGLEIEEVEPPDETQIEALKQNIINLENELNVLKAEKKKIWDTFQSLVGLPKIVFQAANWARFTFLTNVITVKSNLLAGMKKRLASTTETFPVKPIIAEDVDTFQARYQLFKYYLEIAMTYKKLAPAFYKTLGNHLKIKFLSVEKLKPKLLFIEKFRLTNFPGDYGAGTTVKTFSLLPREVTEISIKTWRKSEEVIKKASSILDSYTEEKADEFEKSAQAECARGSKIDNTSSYSVKASANAGWGWGSASVSAGTEGSSSSSREESAKNVLNAAAKHAQSSNAQRDVNIDTEHERKTETGLETSIMRTIRNLNVTRTLNFTFRQMNQQYHSILHLVGLRIGFYNGYPGSFRDYSLGDLVYFVNKYMKNPAEFLEEFKTIILNEYANVDDYHGRPQALIEDVSKGPGGRSYLRVKPTIDEEGNPYGQQEYFMRPEKKDKDGKIVQQEDVRWLDGVILRNQTITMKTDGVIVEALMGKVNALDEYSYLYRMEKIRKRKFENERIIAGLSLVKQLVKNDKFNEAVQAYKQTFGVEPGIEVLKNLFSFKLESTKD